MTERPQFDMSGWMRLIGEVQQLGLDTARTVADRFADLAAANIGTSTRRTGPTDAAMSAWRNMVEQSTTPETQQQLTAAAQSMTDAFIGMMRSAWDFFGESVSSRGAGWGGGAVDLGAAAPGGTTEGTVYVHVRPGEAAAPVGLRVGELASAAGDVLPPEALTITPSDISGAEGGRSYPVTINVAVPPGAVPGSYHGHMFAQTTPPTAVVVHIDVSRP